MGTAKRYSSEVRERAARMVFEQQAEHGSARGLTGETVIRARARRLFLPTCTPPIPDFVQIQCSDQLRTALLHTICRDSAVPLTSFNQRVTTGAIVQRSVPKSRHTDLKSLGGNSVPVRVRPWAHCKNRLLIRVPP
jgi:transposase-like protein